MDPPPVAHLLDELVEEVLVRVPRDDPASLVGAALVCKRWCRLICGPSFRRRLGELHTKPPMLGFFLEGPSGTDFRRTSSFRVPHAVRANWRMLDARHGRVLFSDVASNQRAVVGTELVVWNPVTGGTWRIPVPRSLHLPWTTALLCATAGCDHVDCGRGGPFLVVVVNTCLKTSGRKLTSAYVYSSEEGAWSKATSMQHEGECIMAQGVLVGNALYFSYDNHTRILEYDLCRQQLSVIELPSEFRVWHFSLMETEESGLGFTTIQKSRLYLWRREDGPNGHVEWARRRVIELDKLLPVSYCKNLLPAYVVAIADSVGVVFIWMGAGLFTVHLNSSRVEKIGDFISRFMVVPYISFCTPALDLASTGGEGSRGNSLSASQA